MSDIIALLSETRSAGPFEAPAQTRLATSLILICHHRLGLDDATGLARVSQGRLALLLREVEAIEQAVSVQPLADDIVQASLTGVFSGLVEAVVTEHILISDELIALVAHHARVAQGLAAT